MRALALSLLFAGCGGAPASDGGASDLTLPPPVDLAMADLAVAPDLAMRVRFTQPAIYMAGDGPHAIVAADFDGDGHLDVATADVGTGTCSLFPGVGDGTLRLPMIPPVGMAPVDLAAADLDGDGAIDLALADGAAGQVLVLHNRGKGAFDPPQTWACGAQPTALVAADLDGDGRVDLAVANDAAAAASVHVLRNLGAGMFAASVPYAAGDGAAAIVARDGTGDGRADLFTANAGVDTVSALQNRGDGTFLGPASQAVGPGPRALVIEDLNRDGHLDLAAALPGGGQLAVLLEPPIGPPVLYPAGDTPISVVSADFDGDRAIDLAVADLRGVTVLYGAGDGTFGARETWLVPGPSRLGVADLDGDGRPDLLLALESLGAAGVMLNR